MSFAKHRGSYWWSHYTGDEVSVLVRPRRDETVAAADMGRDAHMKKKKLFRVLEESGLSRETKRLGMREKGKGGGNKKHSTNCWTAVCLCVVKTLLLVTHSCISFASLSAPQQ